MDGGKLLVMSEEGIVGIVVVQLQSAHRGRVGAAERGVLELARRQRLRGDAVGVVVVGRLELGQGHLRVVTVEVVAAAGVPVGQRSHLAQVAADVLQRGSDSRR